MVKDFLGRSFNIFVVIFLSVVCGSVFAEGKAKDTVRRVESKNSKRVVVDRIVAEVAEEVVFLSEVEKKIKAEPVVQFSSYPHSDKDSLFNRALSDLINIKLVEFNAERLQIKIEDADVEGQIDKILSNQGLRRDVLNQSLAAEGKSYKEYKQIIYIHMLVARFKSRVVWPFVKITEKDVQDYYLKHFSKGRVDMIELVLKQVRIDFPKASPDFVYKEKMKQAKEAVVKARKSQSLDSVAAVYSSAFKPGDKGYKIRSKLSDLQKWIRDSLQGKAIGEITDPLSFGSSIYIFQVVDKKIKKNERYLSRKNEIEAAIRKERFYPIVGKWLQKQRLQNKLRIIE